ncbi:MAG: dihydrolipoyllysine-residue succinyltransferase [Mariprofundus sp.]
MADIEIKVPALGESETEATLVSWLRQEGDLVAVDDVLAEIESDKITMEITALEAGKLKTILKPADSTVEPDEVIAILDDSEQPETAASTQASAGSMPASASDTSNAAETAAAESEAASSKAATPEKSVTVDQKPAGQKTTDQAEATAARQSERAAMSRVRKRIAERLKHAQNTAAMLTTFNEVNLQAIVDLRSRFGAQFQQTHGVKLGYISFFVRAVCQALSKYPVLNAYIDGDEIVYHNYIDMGIAVSSDKGLIVPILRNAHQLGLADIEKGIADLAARARNGGLTPDDLSGGTFSITNGGIFGSMLSTPILNPPQSGILGMHAIQQRPIAEGEQIVIRPMMYLALTYDHRLIDGADAVRFLVAIKEALEYPASLTLDL